MQDYELTLQHVLWRIERLHQKRQVVTKRDEGIHRTTYGEMVPRINRLAGALKRLGVKPGDRVATLAWNNSRHLELYYAVPCMGAVLHTLNLRLFPQHLEFIINDAEDKVLFVDQSLLPLLKPLVGKIPTIKTMVLMTDGAAAPLSGQENVTFLAGVPTVWLVLANYLKESGKRLPKVRTVVCGGSAVPRTLMETMDSIGLRILHAWGMTETSPLGSVARVAAGAKPEDELKLRLTQGRVAPGVEIRISDPTSGEELPWDGVAFGEIQVRGPWIARGYHNGYDPGKLTEDGWFRTGDVAKITRDGYILIVDRTKDVIKSGGEWISSVELENAVMAHPKIMEAAVIGLPHPKWDERPVVYAVPKPEFKGKVTQEEVLDFLRDKVAKWWLPDEVRFID